MARNGSFSMGRRNELARARGFRSYAQQRQYGRAVKGRTDLAALPPAAREARQAALDTVALARREGISLTDAARREHSDPAQTAWWVPDAVTRQGGQWHVSAADRMARAMVIYSGGEVREVVVHGSRVASTVGAYHDAVRRYLMEGDPSALQAMTGKKVGGLTLETDPAVLEEMDRRGETEFESIYRMTD